MNTEVEEVQVSDLALWFGKMYPELLAQTKEQTSELSYKKQSGLSVKKSPLFLCLKEAGPQAAASLEWGGDWSVAWRVLDAQFWGVPQRRRRIALVADFGGLTAPEILFERKGVSGYYPQGRTPWERATGSSEKCVRDTGANGLAFCIQGNCIDRADTAGCNGKGWTEDKSYTLNTVDRPAVYDARGNGDGNTSPTMTGDHNNRVTDYSAIVVRGYSQAAYDKFTEDDKTATLKAAGGSYGGGAVKQ